MVNQFKDATDQELVLYCRQYKEWQKIGVIPDNELGKIRDYYASRSSMWQVRLIADLLDVVMERYLVLMD